MGDYIQCCLSKWFPLVPRGQKSVNIVLKDHFGLLQLGSYNFLGVSIIVFSKLTTKI